MRLPLMYRGAQEISRMLQATLGPACVGGFLTLEMAWLDALRVVGS